MYNVVFYPFAWIKAPLERIFLINLWHHIHVPLSSCYLLSYNAYFSRAVYKIFHLFKKAKILFFILNKYNVLTKIFFEGLYNVSSSIYNMSVEISWFVCLIQTIKCFILWFMRDMKLSTLKKKKFFLQWSLDTCFFFTEESIKCHLVDLTDLIYIWQEKF